MNTKVKFSILLILTLSSLIKYSEACSCIMPTPDLSKAFKDYTNIFFGKVAAVTEEKNASLPENEYKIKFVGILNFKGKNPEGGDSYYTNKSSAACGVSVKVGEEWIVYTNPYDSKSKDGKLSVSLCSHTKRYTGSDENKMEVEKLKSLAGTFIPPTSSGSVLK